MEPLKLHEKLWRCALVEGTIVAHGWRVVANFGAIWASVGRWAWPNKPQAPAPEGQALWRWTPGM